MEMDDIKSILMGVKMKTFEAPQLMELGLEFTAEGVFGGSGTPVPNPPSAWLNDDNNNGGSHTDVRVHFQNPLNEACEKFTIYIDSTVPIIGFGSSEQQITKESDTSYRIDVNRHLNANEWTDFMFQVVGENGAIRESGTSGTMTELKIRDVQPLN